MTTFQKTPTEKLDYDINYINVLNQNEIITSSSWNSPAVYYASSFGNTATKVWLYGGTVGQSYILTNTATTNKGRIYVCSFMLKVV
jgi:hypothetical protein